MVVEVGMGEADSITSISVVDPQTLAREKRNERSVAALQQGQQAAGIARQGLGSLSAGMGKSTLIALCLLWIAWFFIPALTFTTPFFQKSVTFWQLLGLDFNNQTSLISHGFFSLAGLAAIAAPLVVPYLRNASAKYLYGAPFAFILLTGIIAGWRVNRLFGEAQKQLGAFSGTGLASQMAEPLRHMFSISFGSYLLFGVSLYLAARVLKVDARNAH